MNYENYKNFIETIKEEDVINYLKSELNYTEEESKKQINKFKVHQDIYDEFKFFLFNYNNGKDTQRIDNYDNFALGFDFSVEEPVTEQGYTAQDLSVKFGNSDKINLDGVAICNLLISLRENPKDTLNFIENEIKPSVNSKYPFENIKKD